MFYKLVAETGMASGNVYWFITCTIFFDGWRGTSPDYADTSSYTN